MATPVDRTRPSQPPAIAQMPVRHELPVIRSAWFMDTHITITAGDEPGSPGRAAAVDRAMAWFHQVETVCSRFDHQSELARLTGRVGQPTPVSDLLYEALAFALAVARASGGAFDPTIGHRLELLGFNQHYRTGELLQSSITPAARPSYRDVQLDPAQRIVTLRQPLALDLGAVAKGLAIDLAARELAPWRDIAIDAGGDLYLGGRNPAGEPWRIGIRHPRQPDALLTTVHVTDRAVCTSGDYERRSTGPAGGHHLIDPRDQRTSSDLASVTVIAPTAMVADALATAAFVLGARRGRRFLMRQGVDGLFVTTALTQSTTPGFTRYLA